MVYVKGTLYPARRFYLESVGTECIWIEIQLKDIKVLFELFYRPSNSDAECFSSIEDSICLAPDTGITDAIITDESYLLYAQSPHNSQDKCHLRTIVLTPSN